MLLQEGMALSMIHAIPSCFTFGSKVFIGEVMKPKMMEQMLSVMQPPVYVIGTKSRLLFCDKYAVQERELIRKARYFLTGGVACTCYSFMQKQLKDDSEPCKHLKMLAEDFSWVGGVSSDDAAEEFWRISNLLKDGFPGSERDWTMPADLPDPVKSITFSFESMTDIRLVCCVNKIGEERVAVIFKVKGQSGEKE